MERPDQGGQALSEFAARPVWAAPSVEVTVPAEILSTAQFSPDHWYSATIPSTVLAAQVAAGEFEDLYWADSLCRLPPVAAREKP